MEQKNRVLPLLTIIFPLSPKNSKIKKNQVRAYIII